jgi:hypothetical protein
MAMVPHERALAERLASCCHCRGTATYCVRRTSTPADGKEIDHAERVKAAVDKNKITWR